MPGMVYEKVKETARGIWANWTGWFTGDSTTAGISENDILDLAQYLQNMGYDIESYGFGIPEYESNDAATGGGKTLDKVNASVDNKNYLKSYLATNENAYALAEISLYGTLMQNATTAWNFVTLGQSEIETAEEVSTGMINIINTNSAINNRFGISKPADYVRINRDAEKMTIYTNAFYSPILDLLGINDGKIQWGSSFSFDLSTWTARYGRPLELLLAIHLSTMMPDLAFRVANDRELNTKVNIVLQDINVKYETNVKSIGGSDVSLNTEQIIDAFLQYGLTGQDHDYSYKETAEAEDEQSDTDTDTDTGTDTDTDEQTSSNTVTGKINIYEQVYNSVKGDKEKEENLFRSIMDESNGILSGTWGINIINVIDDKTSWLNGIIDILSINNPILAILKRIVLNDYYVYIKHGSDIIPELGISYDALFELAQLTSKGLGDGIQNAKWPYIESVTNHWFYNDIDFSTGVYRKATTAKKKISYESASDESALNKENVQVELDATLKADEGVVYQVCEPEAEGPNSSIIDIFTDEYYRYDGTTATAKAINNAKYYEQGKSIEVPTVEKQEVSFEDNKANALTAFSMLENMHSDAADFIYRNLKDLVVALQYFSKDELTTELENAMLWMVKTDNKNEEWEVTKDANKYGLTIKNINGREIIAPEDADITVEGDVATLTFTGMSDETKELLEYIYGDYYKSVNKDILVGMTMKIKGIKDFKITQGHISRGDTIGTASGDVSVKMIDIDKSLIENVEIYMTQKHNSAYEAIMKEKKDRPYQVGIDIGRASRIQLDKGAYNTFVSEFNPNKEITSVTADQQKIFELLRDSGYTYEGVCVIMGVMEAESGFKLTATNKDDGGFGLIQWTNTGDGGRRTNLENWCINNGYGYNTVEGQIAFFNYELYNTYSSEKGWPYPVYETLKSSTSLEDALEMFLCHDMAGVNKSLTDEGPYNAKTNTHTMKQMYDLRLSNAYAYYKFFSDQKF